MNKPEPSTGLPQCIIDERWRDDVAIMSCAGAIDMLTAPQLEARIGEALSKKPASLVVDLSHVDFLASVGMTVLLETREACATGVRFAVVADGPVTSRPMRLMGLADLIPMYPTLSDALAGITV